ncbi:C40 family peptidase [Emticicia agri]|uniref:C40 family peptidase n=1 Tax=Emticicia agri TaxID=2492393 RepID=UPI001E47B938|nr:NlpC/P60 family protein [Emticicia agri]
MLNSKKLIRFLCLISILSSVSSCEVLRSKSKAEELAAKNKPKSTYEKKTVEKHTAEKRTVRKPEVYVSANTRNLIKIARSYTGVPYRIGGNDEQGIDCSGLLCNTFKEFGIKLPRVSWQQSEFFPAIDIPNIRTGDLVFFSVNGKVVNHAGIVTEVRSEDEVIFIHASTSKGVIEDNMMTNYWKARFASACRPDFGK